MKKQKTKTKITISVDVGLNNIMNDIISNKSGYIEWLIYQDISKNKENDERIEKIII